MNGMELVKKTDSGKDQRSEVRDQRSGFTRHYALSTRHNPKLEIETPLIPDGDS